MPHLGGLIGAEDKHGKMSQRWQRMGVQSGWCCHRRWAGGTPRRTQDLVMPGVNVTRDVWAEITGDVIAPTSGAENKSSSFPSSSEGSK